MKNRFLPIYILCSLLSACEQRDFVELAVVRTGVADQVLAQSARLGGSVVDIGPGIEEHGICWSEQPNPTISNQKKNLGSVSGPNNYSLTADGLKAGTIYYFAAYAISGGRPVYGSGSSFTTLSGVSALSTRAPWDHAPNSVMSGGQVADDGGSPVTERGLCWNLTGNPKPGVDATRKDDGRGTGSFELKVEGLEQNKNYHIRAYAINGIGTWYGETVNINLKRPDVEFLDAIGASATSVTLRGRVNANGLETNVSFEYGVNSNYGASITTTPNKFAGNEPREVRAVLDGLTPGATYRARLKATNAVGPSVTPEKTFTTTSSKPVTTTLDPTGITGTGATLKGSVNANGAATTVTFDWGETTSYGNTASATPGTVTGNNPTGVSAVLTGLLPGKTYHYRVKGVNSAGSSNGDNKTFSTPPLKPITITLDGTGNTLRGSVNPNGATTTVTFEWGETTSYGNTVNATPGTVTGNNPISVSAVLTGLTPGKTYHYRVKGVNSAGTSTGENKTFSAAPLKPTTTTLDPTDISGTGATLNGSVNANGASSTVTFEWGETTSYGNTVNATPGTVTGNNPTSVSAVLTGLTPGKTYHYRVKGVNSAGSSNGENKTLSTSALKPTTITLDPTGISGTGATFNGSVNGNGASTTVTFEWGETTGYGNIVSATPGTVTGNNPTSVSAVLTGLTPGKTYHYRVKGVNSAGTNTGDNKAFTPVSSLAVLSTTSASNVDQSFATSGGNITSDGGSPVTSRGVCWSTSPLPTINNNKTSDGSGPGVFSSTLLGLSPGTLYYVRAYAINAAGPSYGNQISLVTSIGDIDGNTYPVVQIGNQFWMARNLAATRYNDGSMIEFVIDTADWMIQSTGAYSWYQNNSTYKPTYGALYNWYAVDSKKLCPGGWHAPSDTEWSELVNYLGSNPGGKLKTTGTIEAGNGIWRSPNTEATNSSGFNGVPGGGRRDADGGFDGMGYYGSWWSSSAAGTGLAWHRYIYHNSSTVGKSSRNRGTGFSLRCVKD